MTAEGFDLARDEAIAPRIDPGQPRPAAPSDDRPRRPEFRGRGARAERVGPVLRAAAVVLDANTASERGKAGRVP